MLWLCGSMLMAPMAHAEVRLDGLDREQVKNVRAWLALDKLPADAARDLVQQRFRRAREDIRTALQPLGYYRPDIEDTLRFPESGWLATFRISPGPRTQVVEALIEIEGPGAATLTDLRQLGDPLVGKALHHADYRKLKSELLDRAFNSGFIDARLTRSKLVIDPDQHQARIELQLSSGPQYVFGDIQVEQDILDEDFLARYIHIESGDPFDADALLSLQLRLTDLDYFQDLDVRTQTRPESSGVMDVMIKATPRNSQRYQIGVGYGTDTGPRLSTSVEFRRLNRRGHRLRGDYRISQVKESASAQYIIPTGYQVGANWTVKLRFGEEDLGDTRTQETVLGLSRNRLDGPRLWQYYVNYELESFRFAEGISDTELLTPGVSLTLRNADDQLNPRRGYKLFFDVHGAHKDVVSSASFTQTLLSARWITPISSRSRLLLRGQLGSSFVGELSELPVSQRFFAGGDQSIRGYGYQSLGPRNADGEVIGGEHLTLLSIEADRLFWKNYGAAIFFDFGGASNQPGELLQRGIGLGFRWRTGIGMLRADVAHPLDDPDDDFRIHIGIGAEL